jgi:uncharacterized protein (DUF697 family)
LEENKSKQILDNAKDITKKAVLSFKDISKKAIVKAKVTSQKMVNTAKNTITEEQMQEILNTLYIKSVNGIPKVSLPIDDLVEDYIGKNDTIDKAVKSLINNSTVKCGTSGFLTAFGGFATMIATLPANITSVLYVQLRMCCAIAKMGGYDIHSDQVQTLIYACLTGSAISDVLKHSGIKFTQKFGTAMIERIPGKTLTAINRKVGFRFVTKFGETGVVNLGKVIPVVGGIVGGSTDVTSTRIIGNNAYKLFVKGEMPSENEDDENIIIQDVEVIEQTEDIDTQTLKEAVENNVEIDDNL